MNIVLLYSGGLDSTVLMYQLLEYGHTVTAVGVDYGQPHRHELAVASKLAWDAGVKYVELELPDWMGITTDGVIFPNRNAILVSLAGGIAMSKGSSTVAIAVHGGDRARFPDCRHEWVEAMNLTLRLASDQQVGLHAPFVHIPKQRIVALGRRLGVPLDQTWSCYGAGSEPCGTCLACIGRKEALA